MAVVFISPKQRQRNFFMIITVTFVLILVAISLGVFLSKPSAGNQELVFNKPKVNIDMKVFDSDQFKNLQPASEMEMQYSYDGITADKQKKSGFISAVSETKAREILTGMGITTITNLKEAEVGRDNPFTPYYETSTSSDSTTSSGKDATVNTVKSKTTTSK